MSTEQTMIRVGEAMVSLCGRKLKQDRWLLWARQNLTATLCTTDKTQTGVASGNRGRTTPTSNRAETPGLEMTMMTSQHQCGCRVAYTAMLSFADLLRL